MLKEMNLITSLKKFNQLIFEEVIQNLSYDFKNDKDGNIFCDFKIGDSLVNAKKFNDEVSFIITDKNGESSELTEKEFSVKYNNKYKKFIDLLKKYEETEMSSDNEASPINQMSDVLEKEETKEDGVKLEKDIKIGDTIFNFKILEDLAVENYAQCIFQYFNENAGETLGFKCLLFIKQANSLLIKTILQNEKGETLSIMPEEDFKNRFEDLYKDFQKAVGKFEEFFNR